MLLSIQLVFMSPSSSIWVFIMMPFRRARVIHFITAGAHASYSSTSRLPLWGQKEETSLSFLGVKTVFLFFFFFFFGFWFLVFSRQGSWLSWNSLCRPGWPWTQKSACLCLPSAGIKGLHHHAWLTVFLFLRKHFKLFNCNLPLRDVLYSADKLWPPVNQISPSLFNP
jgi:hypothetical protein